ncbi:hypothetical protein Fcan01_08931 [Folsomia candida]|uniref:Uncharacterized protein n=1 Tax=Folsomia candida TaxID=158441 RepID=A0A226EE47_FOLCA|nr:hypothetical protein Fcan01_08931 [Folsomia candida]
MIYLRVFCSEENVDKDKMTEWDNCWLVDGGLVAGGKWRYFHEGKVSGGGGGEMKILGMELVRLEADVPLSPHPKSNLPPWRRIQEGINRLKNPGNIEGNFVSLFFYA